MDRATGEPVALAGAASAFSAQQPLLELLMAHQPGFDGKAPDKQPVNMRVWIRDDGKRNTTGRLSLTCPLPFPFPFPSLCLCLCSSRPASCCRRFDPLPPSPDDISVSVSIALKIHELHNNVLILILSPLPCATLRCPALPPSHSLTSPRPPAATT